MEAFNPFRCLRYAAVRYEEQFDCAELILVVDDHGKLTLTHRLIASADVKKIQSLDRSSITEELLMFYDTGYHRYSKEGISFDDAERHLIDYPWVGDPEVYTVLENNLFSPF